MDIEHSGLLSWVHERQGRPKTQKPCARWRDADRNKRSASGDPAMVLVFRMASIFRVVTGTVPVTPSGRIAAGRCTFEHDRFGKTDIDFFRNHALAQDRFSKIAKSDCQRSCNRRAAYRRAYSNKLNDECCASRSAPCYAPRRSSSDSREANGASTRA